MTNPNNAVGTNAAYDGRTSVNAFNDALGAFSSGIISGWACAPDSGMTVSLGGDGNTRDVAIAEDNAGNKTSINNISGSPVNVTLDAAPGANSRIDLVVAYVDNPPQGTSTVADNPSACGIINVTGTAASTPVAPNDSAIRTAITGDGASGTTAYYVILAQILVANGTTDIDAGMITAGATATANNNIVNTNSIANKAITASKIDFSTLSGNYSTTEVDTGYTWIDGSKIYKKTVDLGYLPNNGTKTVLHNISNLKLLIEMRGAANFAGPGYQLPLPCVCDPLSGGLESGGAIRIYINSTEIKIDTGYNRSTGYGYITLYYTKTS